MILSHKYKFIFLKTNKTAGTSIEIALSKFCGKEDIITPIEPKDERIRKQLGFRGAQNYHIGFGHYTPRDWALFFGRGRRKRFYNHITAREVKNLIDPHIWRDYYKFCFERNPWDRVISLYYWRHQQEPLPSISEFIDSDEPYRLVKKGFELYSINGQIVVDKVGLYENLNQELEDIGDHLGFPDRIVLPDTKRSSRKDKRPYRELLSEQDRVKIARMFAREIAYFGYEF